MDFVLSSQYYVFVASLYCCNDSQTSRKMSCYVVVRDSILPEYVSYNVWSHCKHGHMYKGIKNASHA